MYEINTTLGAYYSELDPAKRLELLDSLDAPEFVRTLYHERYSDHEKKGRKNVDWWLWRCICLQSLYNRGSFFKSFRTREMNAIISELFMTDGEHTAYLYHEYRNLARRYLSTCRGGGYAARFMGLRQATEEEQVLRACADIWEMSAGIARKTGNREKMQVWCEAFRDELFEHAEICREEYSKLEAKL